MCVCGGGGGSTERSKFRTRRVNSLVSSTAAFSRRDTFRQVEMNCLRSCVSFT